MTCEIAPAVLPSTHEAGPGCAAPAGAAMPIPAAAAVVPITPARAGGAASTPSARAPAAPAASGQAPRRARATRGERGERGIKRRATAMATYLHQHREHVRPARDAAPGDA